MISMLDQACAPEDGGRVLPYSVNPVLSATGSIESKAGPTPLLSLSSTADYVLSAAFATPIEASYSSQAQPEKKDNKDFDSLVKMLLAAQGGPAESVKQGNAPLPQNVGIIPPSKDKNTTRDITKHYNYLVQVSSLSALFTGTWNIQTFKKRGREEPYNISIKSEAVQAFADLADSGFQAMIGPLASYYNISNAVVSIFKKQMRKTEVHLEFLRAIFKPYNLLEDALARLDGVLTTLVDALHDIQIETSKEVSSVNQTLRINQLKRMNVTGDRRNPVWVYVPTTRVVYMKINAETWKGAVGRKGSDEGFEFKMEVTVIDGELNVEKYERSKEKLDEVFTYVTGINLQAFGDKTDPKPVESQEEEEEDFDL